MNTRLVRAIHWILSRLLILHTLVLLMLLADLSQKANKAPPVSIWLIYLQIFVTCVCTFTNVLLPKRWIQVSLMANVASHVGLALTFLLGNGWGLSRWLKAHTCVKCIATAAVYIRMLAANAPPLDSHYSRVGISIHSTCALLAGLASIPINSFINTDLECQQYEFALNWPIFRRPYLQSVLALVSIFVSVGMMLPLIVPVLLSQANRFNKQLRRMDLMLAVLTLMTMLIKDSNFVFGRNNKVQPWLQASWLANDFNLVIGLAVIHSMYSIELPSRPKSAGKEATKPQTNPTPSDKKKSA